MFSGAHVSQTARPQGIKDPLCQRSRVADGSLVQELAVQEQERGTRFRVWRCPRILAVEVCDFDGAAVSKVVFSPRVFAMRRHADSRQGQDLAKQPLPDRALRASLACTAANGHVLDLHQVGRLA